MCETGRDELSIFSWSININHLNNGFDMQIYLLDIFYIRSKKNNDQKNTYRINFIGIEQYFDTLADLTHYCSIFEKRERRFNLIILEEWLPNATFSSQILIRYLLKQNMKDNSKQSNSSIPFQGFFCYPLGIYICPVPLPCIQAYQQLLDDREQIIVKQEVKEEYESEPIKEIFRKNIVKFSPYIYPGETKNYYKNIGKKLTSFIINSFDQSIVKQDPFIIQFIKIESQNYNRTHFQKLFKSKVARRIAREFFGNFLWCSKFIQQNKTDIDLYFRHNQQMYQRKKRYQSPAKK